MSNVTAIIQARMGSTRLPGKILREIAGQPMLGCVVARARRAETIDHVLVATTIAVSDNALAMYCADRGISCFRGNEDDVLDRYYQAARHVAADVVVRITADCPLIDPSIIDMCVSTFLNGDYDYVSNVLPPPFPMD